MATSPPLPEPLLIDDHTAAALAGIGRSTFRRLHAAGKTPAGIRLGRCRRWSREELLAWIASGCPDRRTWEAMLAQRRRTHE